MNGKSIETKCLVGRLVCTISQHAVHLLTAVILALPATRSAAQTPQIYFDHLSTSDGLSQNSVSFILQDCEGFMWFATQAGLDRYDGVDFLHFANIANNAQTIRGGFVTSLLEDTATHLLYVGTTLGLSSLQLRNGYKVQHYAFKSREKEQHVLGIKKDAAGTMWVVTTRQLYQLRQDSLLPVSLPDMKGNINDFAIDPTGKWGMLATQHGLFRIPLEQPARLVRIQLEWLPPDSIVRRVAIYKQDLLVTFEKNAYLIRKRPSLNNNDSVQHYGIAKELLYKHKVVDNKKTSWETHPVEGGAAIQTDKEGNYWIGTSRNGLLKFSPTLDNGREFLRDFNDPKSLSSTYIQSIGTSSEGSLWVGTDGGGVNKYDITKPAFFRYYTSNYQHVDLTPNIDLWSIYQLRKNELLLGTDGNGIVNFNVTSQKMLNHYFNRNERASNIVRSLALYDSSLLIGTQGGLFIAPLSNLHAYKKQVEACNKSITSVAASPKFIWAGTADSGLTILDRNLQVQARFFQPPSGSRRINSLLYTGDKQEMLAGTSHGCFLFDASNQSFPVKNTFLPGYYITCLSQQNDTLWIGTKGDGLFCIDRKSGKTLLAFNNQNGLTDQSIYGIVNDGTGKIWFSTNKGISVYFTADSTFNHYTRSYGLQHDEFNLGAYNYAPQTDREKAYFAGINGLNVFNPLAININKKDYQVGLLFYRKHDTTQLITRTGSTGELSFEVDPMEDYTRLKVRIFDYTDPGNNKYKYRLNDGPWSSERSVKDELIIARSQLHIFGNDKLELAVRNSNGTWKSLSPVEVILPGDLGAQYKYYGDSIFYTTIILIAALLFFLISFVSANRRLKKQKVSLEQQKVNIERSQAALRTAHISLEEKVEQLDHEKRKYEEISQDLTIQNERITEFQQLLEEITRCEDPLEFKQKVQQHLTNSRNFQFDFAIFSEVDYFENVLRSGPPALRPSVATRQGPPSPHDIMWIVPLRSYDLAAIAVESNILYETNGAAITPAPRMKAVPGDMVPGIIGHNHLYRLYIPVSISAVPEYETTTEPTLALLEIGYAQQKPLLEETQRTKLNIYASNLAFAYKRYNDNYRKAEIKQIFEEAVEKSKEKHLTFLECLLTSVCEKVQADFGGIAFQTFNSPNIADNGFACTYEKAPGRIPGDAIRTFGYKSLQTGNTEYNNELIFDNISGVYHYSYLSVPIKHDGQIIACAEIISLETAFFNAVNTSFVHDVFSKAGETFVNMKFHNTVTDMVSPHIMSSKPEEELVPVIKSIRRYFQCDYVSIWMRTYTDDRPEYKLVKASEGILPDCSNPDEKTRIIDENSIEELKAHWLATKEATPTNAPFWEFGHNNGMQSFIHVPLRIGAHNYGFINIYSKRKLDTELFTQDRQFLELISNKAIVSYVSSKMVSNFSEISQLLARENLSSLLQKISDSAREVLNADPVLLFRFEEGEVRYSQTIRSGFLYDPKRILEGRKSNFTELILKMGADDQIVKEEQLPPEYDKYSEENGQQRPNFWVREKIASMAYTILKHEGNTIGIMFFNYRKHQAFPSFVKELIKTFSALAATTINTIANINRIKLQEQALKEKSDQLEIRVEEALENMNSMLPTAEAISLTEIMMIINHDVRTNLLKLDISSESILKRYKDYELMEIQADIKNDIKNAEVLIDLFAPGSFRISDRVDLNELVRKIALSFNRRLQKNKNGITINLSGLNNVKDIRCSVAIMSMIIYNLVSNAHKAIRELWEKKGRPTKSPEGEISIGTDYSDKDNTYTLQVKDNGIGIDKQNLRNIYKIKFSTSKQGMGIGLYFVNKTITDVFNGSIHCESTVGKGTTFTLKFRQQSKD